MKITITHNGVKIQKNIPVSWDEVSFRTFLDLAKIGRDSSKILSLFTGVDEDIIRAAKIVNLDNVLTALSFLETKLSYAIPEKVNGYDIPKNLEFKSTGQFEDLKQECAKFDPQDGFKNMERYPVILATYALKDYSWEAAEALAPIFLDAPCQEVLAVGNFTLMKLRELNESGKLTYLQAVSPMTRLRLAMRGYLRSLASSARSLLWKRQLRSAGMNS